MKIRLCLFVVILFLSTTVFGFIQNLSNETNVLHLSNYNDDILKKENKIFFSSETSVEEYHILDDGSLQFIKFISKKGLSTTKSQIIGDSLYVIERDFRNSSNYLMTINITGNEMELVNETLLYLDENQLIYNLAHYKHYLFYTGTFSLINHIFDLNTMSNVDEYEYGGSYTIKDSLFFHWATNADSARLSIVNISDINQPVDISEVIFSPSDAIIQYKFYGNTLFALGSDHVFVFDFNNINNPTLLSNVEINTSFGLKSCVLVNNYLIVKDY